MVHIREIYGELEKRNSHAAVVLAESQRLMKGYLEKNEFPFPVLSDVRRTATKAYGVYVRLNIESVNMARPACFIVDTQGLVRYIYVGSNQTDFPPDEDIFSHLDMLGP